MISKVLLFCAAVAVAHSSLIGSGIVAPGLLNAGLLGPGLGLKGAPIATAINTGSIVAIPGAVTTDKRVIGTTGLWGAAPLGIGNGLIANGLVANGLVANGLLGGAPLAWGNGIISPVGLKGAGILAGPGMVKTIL